MVMSHFRYVSDEGILNLKKHEFHAGEYTPLDLAMNPFWLWCQRLLPRWISPNAVSLFGGLSALLGTIIVVSSDRTSLRRVQERDRLFIFHFVQPLAMAQEVKSHPAMQLCRVQGAEIIKVNVYRSICSVGELLLLHKCHHFV